MRHRLPLLIAGLLSLAVWVRPAPAEPTWQAAVSILEQACWDCHSDSFKEGEVDLSSFASEADAMANHHLWQKVQQLVKNQEMPPADATPLSTDERELLLGWIDRALQRVARANAGDPGRVTLRRLTNTEYDNTIRDLTGLDLKLSEKFVKDSGGGEGFTNTGDVLFVSPEQLAKYLDAAREVAQRASVLPGSGIEFHAEPVGLRGPGVIAAEVNARIRSWYFDRLGPMLPDKFEEMRMESYLHACWRHHHGQGDLAQLAKSYKLDPIFLENWWNFLQKETSNPFANRIRIPWQQLPGPGHDAEVVEQITAIVAEQKGWAVDLPYDYGAKREEGDAFFSLCVADMGDGNRGDVVQWLKLEVILENKQKVPLFDYVQQQIELHEKQIAAGSGDPKRLQAQLAKLRATLALRGTHPEGSKAPEEGFAVLAPSNLRIWLPEEVRGLHAGSRLDPDHPESKLASVQTNVISGQLAEVPSLIVGIRFKFAEKSAVEGKFWRAFKAKGRILPGSRARRLEETGVHLRENRDPEGIYYLNREQFAARLPEHEREIPRQIADDYRLVALLAKNRLEPKHAALWNELVQEHLAEFAKLAYRRPLTEAQRQSLNEQYVRAVEEVENREEAAREVIARILVSPRFLFKTEPPHSEEPESRLDAWELASRLSYFLWATMPDEELREAAADGSLLEPQELDRQVTRMLASPKAAALATEFAGQWLGFHDFRENATIDRKIFPAFDDDLRDSMYQEVAHFFTELVVRDRPITDILHGDYTYLDKRLAEHYGIKGFKPSEDGGFTRWEMHQPRGGILGMGAILASTAFPDRASPVRRGNWIVTTVLGYETPPVPANVPELASDGLADKLSLRKRLEKHRDSPSCMGCHSRIDPPGFALQNFDAIGRWCETDAEGRPIDATATLSSGEQFTGPVGLKEQLARKQSDFLRQFCTKLLGYALGREVVITDRPLLEKMEADLAQADYRFSAAVRAVVQSRQFQYRRNK